MKKILKFNEYSGMRREYSVAGHDSTHSSGLLVITTEFTDCMLVKQDSEDNYWSIPGGYLGIKSSGINEDPLVSAIEAAYKKMSNLPNGRLFVPPIILRNDKFEYSTYILKVTENEKNKYSPKSDNDKDIWKWFKIDEIKEGKIKRVHPVLIELFKDYF